MPSESDGEYSLPLIVIIGEISERPEGIRKKRRYFSNIRVKTQKGAPQRRNGKEAVHKNFREEVE
ncbi:MAG: hypothetical protein EA428_14420 [Spirochaetaceae bacterium]|nr:MAG: hypothetical protein EA428_14420 [Spirochaetaceae bacterium]